MLVKTERYILVVTVALSIYFGSSLRSDINKVKAEAGKAMEELKADQREIKAEQRDIKTELFAVKMDLNAKTDAILRAIQMGKK
ncbi:hypothetical protein GPALN_006866 [Globodera pallida]|nr:hypothetical protein GPALN_006866 [Globodera pallida]